MPSSTYHKLEAKKQARFYNVALKEFSAHGYYQASITKIVSTLGIAKGSVYQYFNDKYDLYRYLLTSSIEKLEAVRKLVDRNFEGDLSQWFVSRCMAEIKFMKQFPQAYELITKTLCDRSGDLSELKNLINDSENEAIGSVLKSSNAELQNVLAYTIRAVKDKYLFEVHSGRDDKEIAVDLISLASIIFVTNQS